VTPTAAAVGAVKADLSADLLTVGKSLPLGSVQSQTSINNIHLSGRLIGVGLLILVLVIVAGWLVSRTGKAPAFRRRDI
jgi:flagellar biogenesis protein FliO